MGKEERAAKPMSKWGKMQKSKKICVYEKIFVPLQRNLKKHITTNLI